jgi:A/G-specific adenine glycosylase
MAPIQEIKIGSKISNWYALNGRKNLPWRENITPYRVWISEIMLQQTQVNTAIDYFNRFMKKYPDLAAIKEASEDDIYSLWSGLGYYRRASYIYKAKELIHKDFSGKMPESFEDIISLPGIGKSTAGAILSIAFNKPYPILDANVKKVISRIFYKEAFEEKSFWTLSEEILDKNNLFKFQQGVMDLGSQLCLPKNPKCTSCPVNNNCLANSKGKYPLLAKKKIKKTSEYLRFNLIKQKNKYFLTKNNTLGYWKNLWIPPVEHNEPSNIDVVHNLSHRKLNISFFESNKSLPKIEGKWFSPEEIKKIATPKPIFDRLVNNG